VCNLRSVDELKKDGDVPGGYQTVVAYEDRSDSPLHTIRTAGCQGSEVLNWGRRGKENEGLDRFVSLSPPP